MTKDGKKYTQEQVDLRDIQSDIKAIKSDVAGIKLDLENKYVTEEKLALVLKDIMPYVLVVKAFLLNFI